MGPDSRDKFPGAKLHDHETILFLFPRVCGENEKNSQCKI